MAEQLRNVFALAKQEQRQVLVSFVTCGFPTLDDTVDILLGLEAGGTDIIELGVPFTDALADGPVICKANDIALANGVTLPVCLEVVRTARERGLRTPVLLMGYYNPLLMYGEERIVADSKAAGVNGFIVVDLPPEEAIRFREFCTRDGLSYVPLIAPSTSDKRIAILAKIADSFIYVVSRMGTTGSSATGTMSATLPALCRRIRTYTHDTPLAVGFGVSTRDHYLSVGKIADGVVIGSRIVTELLEAKGHPARAVEDYIRTITLRGQHDSEAATATTRDVGVVEAIAAVGSKTGLEPTPSATISATSANGDYGRAVLDSASLQADALPPRFGEYGGQYVPESLMDCLAELEQAFAHAKEDPEFWREFRSYYDYMGRPSRLDLAQRLTDHVGGARIWLKREDMNHTGSHKINNAMGQVLLAKRLGKNEVIAETGAGQHGVATATVAAKFGMKCTVYMGAEDVRRQALNVFRMKLLGAQVIAVESGTQTLRDAVNEAMRAWVTNLSNTHYVIGSAIGPHPFPTLVRTFQSVIGNETKVQMQEKMGKLPDAVIACVGGGSNSTGMFYPFAQDPSVRLIGVEAGGDGVDTARHSATLSCGSKGVFHGVRTYVLQDKEGQIQATHSVSAGLDYPGVGPELAMWKDQGRAEFMYALDHEVFEGFRILSQLEGIIPALESSHAIFGGMKVAAGMRPDQDVVICVSGRGDKDVETVAEELPKLGPKIGWDLRF